MTRFLTVALGLSLAAPAFANQPDLSALITDTVGYVNVAPNVVIFEGDEFDTFICRIDVSDAAFDEYLETGSLVTNNVGYACIPIGELEK